MWAPEKLWGGFFLPTESDFLSHSTTRMLIEQDIAWLDSIQVFGHWGKLIQGIKIRMWKGTVTKFSKTFFIEDGDTLQAYRAMLEE